MRIFIFMLLNFSLFGCQQSQNKDVLLNKYLIQHLGIQHENIPSVIVVVTEDGCPACDRSFADLVRERTSVPKCLFVVRATGASIDLSGFLNETDQIRYDDDGAFKALGLLKASGFILLDHGRLDSVISIRVDEYKEQLTFVTSLLDSLERQAVPQ